MTSSTCCTNAAAARSSRRGFTLVELLVVVSIVAILIAMLLPAVSQAKYEAKKILCLSNYKQMAIAMQMYVEDNKGWMLEKTMIRNEYLTKALLSADAQHVGIMGWYPYLKTGKAFLCPDAPTNGSFSNAKAIDQAYLVPTTRTYTTFLMPLPRYTGASGAAAGLTGYNRWVTYERKPSSYYISGRLDDNLRDVNNKIRPLLVDVMFTTPNDVSQYSSHILSSVYGVCHQGKFSPVLYGDGAVLGMKDDFIGKYFWGYRWIGDTTLSWMDGSDLTALLAVRP